jgi:hypothetical protein
MSLPLTSLSLGARKSESGDYLEIYTTVDGVDFVLSAIKFGFYTQGLENLAAQAQQQQQQADTPAAPPQPPEQ